MTIACDQRTYQQTDRQPDQRPAPELRVQPAPAAAGWDIRVGIHSEQGMRPKNDDCARAAAVDVFALADGIGGAPYGDVMARAAVGLSLDLAQGGGGLGTRPARRLGQVFGQVDAYVTSLARLLGEPGAGTTLVLAARQGDELWVASVGDSAAFRLRDGQIARLTPIGRRGASSNRLSQAIGYGSLPAPATWHGTLRAGDVFLLCSDGVWSGVGEQDLAALLTPATGADPNPPAAAYDVATTAVRADNATALVLSVLAADGKRAPHVPSALVDYDVMSVERTLEA